MKSVIITILVITIAATLTAVELKPEIHSSIMLDAKFFSGDRANDGSYDTADRIQVRKASLAFEGELGERLEYAMEAGVATCVGTGDNLQLLEAILMYRLTNAISVGVQKSHVLRGFSTTTECSDRLGTEKPDFIKSFGDCHPMGGVLRGEFGLPANMEIETELAIMNGPGGTLNEEHEYNLGAILTTPIEGLAVAGAYTATSKKYFDEDYLPFFDDGWYGVGGVNYQAHGLWLTAEYFTGEGFERSDQQVQAWYAQSGYAFMTGWKSLSKIQPYARYESWDKDTDADAETLYTTIEGGVNLYLAEPAKLRFAWRSPMETPDGVDEEPSSFVVRLQAGF